MTSKECRQCKNISRTYIQDASRMIEKKDKKELKSFFRFY